MNKIKNELKKHINIGGIICTAMACITYANKNKKKKNIGFSSKADSDQLETKFLLHIACFEQPGDIRFLRGTISHELKTLQIDLQTFKRERPRYLRDAATR